MRPTYLIPALLLAFVFGATCANAQVMPDPKEIAGVPLPVGDLPTGTVTVRLIRGSLANNLPGQVVELYVDNVARQQKTTESGRAEFTGLRPGARVRAVCVVDGERLESREFPVPAAGGVRLILVATDRLASAAAQPGTVVLGEQSRFVFELADGAINVFNILQIVNSAGVAVDSPQPVSFETPAGGSAVSILSGSSPRAAAKGRQVTVAGPFPPGPTMVQFAYAVPYTGQKLTIEQRVPVALNQVTVMAQKVGEMGLASPQLVERREMSARGETYIVAQGPGVKGGDTLSFSFTGLPHAPVWPRNLALAIAALILIGGAWSSVRLRRGAPTSQRSELEARRERLFTELAAIERRQRTEGAGASIKRRQQLVTELESIYAALDH